MSEPLLKVIVCGDSSVGKTSIIDRYDNETYTEGVSPTVGAGYLKKHVETEAGAVDLIIWDTAGQEKYRSLIPTYGRGASAAVLCYDVTSLESFNSLNDNWLDAIHVCLSPDCLLFIVGNKIDLPEVVPGDSARKWAAAHHAECFFTSAKTGIGIRELFDKIASELALRGACKLASSIPLDENKDDKCGC